MTAALVETGRTAAARVQYLGGKEEEEEKKEEEEKERDTER